ncbi:tetratricopeptide repeat protein [candidate division WOR-3 bacterium]|nr:tetratricopeptide repeat protein [candidate division WOR-3 bacterium]
MKQGVTFGDILLAETKAEEERLLKEFIRAQPTNVTACLKLGNILRKKGNYLGALKLDKSLLIAPKLPLHIKRKIYHNIAEDYIGAEKPELALSFARDLQKIAAKDPEIYEFLCSLYEDLLQWREAIKSKQKALKVKRQSDNRSLAILYSFWGNSLIEQENKKEGLKHLKEALKIDKLCLPALLFMGDFYYEDGDAEQGIEFWKKILDELPVYSFLVFHKLEKAYYAKHDFSKIEELYISFLERNPEDVRTLLLLSEICEKRGEDDEAINLLEKAKEIAPDNMTVKKKLFKLYYDTERYEDMFKEGMFGFTHIYKDFKCYKCNKEFENFKFKCPHCKNWLTIR